MNSPLCRLFKDTYSHSTYHTFSKFNTQYWRHSSQNAAVCWVVWCLLLSAGEAVPQMNNPTSSFTACHNNPIHSFISTPESFTEASVFVYMCVCVGCSVLYVAWGQHPVTVISLLSVLQVLSAFANPFIITTIPYICRVCMCVCACVRT